MNWKAKAVGACATVHKSAEAILSLLISRFLFLTRFWLLSGSLFCFGPIAAVAAAGQQTGTSWHSDSRSVQSVFSTRWESIIVEPLRFLSQLFSFLWKSKAETVLCFTFLSFSFLLFVSPFVFDENLSLSILFLSAVSNAMSPGRLILYYWTFISLSFYSFVWSTTPHHK